MNFYCMPLWCSFRQNVLRKIRVAYNNVFRNLFSYDRRFSASLMFVSNDVLNFDALRRKFIYDFRCRIFASRNVLLMTLRDNFDVYHSLLFYYIIWTLV